MGFPCLRRRRRNQKRCIGDGISYARCIVHHLLRFDYIFVIRILPVLVHIIMIIQNTGTTQGKSACMRYGRPPSRVIISSHDGRAIFIFTCIPMSKRIPFYLITQIVLIIIAGTLQQPVVKEFEQIRSSLVHNLPVFIYLCPLYKCSLGDTAGNAQPCQGMGLVTAHLCPLDNLIFLRHLHQFQFSLLKGIHIYRSIHQPGLPLNRGIGKMAGRFAVYGSPLDGKGIHVRIALKYSAGNQRLKRKRSLVHPFIRTVIERIRHFQHFRILRCILLCPSVLIADRRRRISENLRRKGKLIQYHARSDNICAPSIAPILLGGKFLRIIGLAVGTDNIHGDIEIILISCHPPHNGLHIGCVGILAVSIAYVGMRPVLIGIYIVLTGK